MSEQLNNIRYNNRTVKKIKKTISSVLYWFGNIIFFYKKKNYIIPKDEIKKILFISLYFRGDVLFHTSVIRMLKLYFNNAAIDVWVKSRSKEILEGNEDISSVMVFDGVETDMGNLKSNVTFKDKREFLKKLKKLNYDLVVDYTGLFSTGLVAHLLNPGYSVGKFEQRFGFFYNKFIDVDLSIINGNLIEKYQNILKTSFDIPETDWLALKKSVPPKSIIYLSSENKDKIKNILIERNYDLSKPLITIHLTAGWEAKRWDLNRFSDLIIELLKTKMYEIAVIGNTYDRSEFSKISGNFSGLIQVDKINSMFFEYPLNLNAALIERSNVFIGSDSVPLHISGAVDTPSIGLFGPTNPVFSNPIGKEHHFMYFKLECSSAEYHQYCTRNAGRSCSTIDCMKLITVQDIIKKVNIIIKS